MVGNDARSVRDQIRAAFEAIHNDKRDRIQRQADEEMRAAPNDTDLRSKPYFRSSCATLLLGISTISDFEPAAHPALIGNLRPEPKPMHDGLFEMFFISVARWAASEPGPVGPARNTHRSSFSEREQSFETPSMRILLVEDYKPYRSLISSLLSEDHNLELVGEAEDGLEAVEEARQLKPDIILMDIGLPKLNGLAAARRMLDLVPSAKIIFLTQETDADVVKEALNLGARGYVLKQYAEAELLAAIAAVLAGKRFFSLGLGDGGFDVQKTSEN